MALTDNIKIIDGNFSRGPSVGDFYTINRGSSTLRQVTSNGTLSASFFLTLSQLRNDVTELHYDGTFFWTLEDLPSDLGVVIKKWRLYPFKTAVFPNVNPSELRWQDELTLIHRTNIRWSSKAFATEHFHRTFSFSASQGDSSIKLNDTSRIEVGDILYLGPSNAGGFSGVEEEIAVGGIAGNTITFTKSGGLESGYSQADPVDFVKALWVFNDHGYSGSADNRGTINRFAWPSKTTTLVGLSHVYNGVAAADFDTNFLSFVRGDQIIQLDIDSPTYDFSSSLEANLRVSDKKTYIPVFDLISDQNDNLFYKLQQKITTSEGTVTEDHSPQFNYATVTNVAIVNSTALEFDNRFTGSISSGDTLNIKARVRDQFNFPALGETVQFSATANVGIPGTFAEPQVLTNTSGIAENIYTPSLTLDPILVNTQAEVLPNTTSSNSNIVVAVVSQTGRFAQDTDHSKPVQQIAPFTTVPGKSKPIHQTAPLTTVDARSRPVEQAGVPEFSPLSREASVIEQKSTRTTDDSSPVEQVKLSSSSKIVEQVSVSTDDNYSKPLEQQATPEGEATVEQFDFIEDIFPECGSTKNPVNTDIRWRIRDFGFTLDADTIVFKVQGVQVQDTDDFTVTLLGGTPAGLELIYDSPVDYPYDTEMVVTLFIQDTADPVNTFQFICKWTTVPDVRSPIFSNIQPECDSTNVDSFAPISFDVTDVGAGVDLDSIEVTIEGVVVCSGLSFEAITTVTSGTGFHGVYVHPDDPFRYGSNVTLGLQASDLSATRNSTLFICCFSIEDSESPYFTNFDPVQCKSFVDNRTGFTFEVYGAEQGVDISTLEVHVDSRLRKVFVRPRILRDE